MSEFRLTIRELAEQCGFSRSTVARALKNDPATSEKTRKKVQALARELGYQPDPILSNIGARAWRRPREMRANLGYVIASSTQTAPRVDERIIEKLEKEGVGEGYRVEVVDLDEGERSPAAICHNLFHRGVRGLFFSASIPPERLREIPLDRFACLAVGLGHTPHVIDIVRRDIPVMDEELWEEILRRGYRRVGYAMIAHPDRPASEAENLMFYHYYKHRTGLKGRPFVSLRYFDPGRGGQLADWVRKNRIEVVIGFNCGTLFDLEAEGVKVPKDVAFASARIPSREKRVTGFANGIDQLCHEALVVMGNKLRRGRFGCPPHPKRIMMRSPWIEGETLPWKKGEETQRS